MYAGKMEECRVVCTGAEGSKHHSLVGMRRQFHPQEGCRVVVIGRKTTFSYHAPTRHNIFGPFPAMSTKCLIPIGVLLFSFLFSSKYISGILQLAVVATLVPDTYLVKIHCPTRIYK